MSARTAADLAKLREAAEAIERTLGDTDAALDLRRQAAILQAVLDGASRLSEISHATELAKNVASRHARRLTKNGALSYATTTGWTIPTRTAPKPTPPLTDLDFERGQRRLAAAAKREDRRVVSLLARQHATACTCTRPIDDDGSCGKCGKTIPAARQAVVA